MSVPQILLSSTADASRLGLGWFGRPVDMDQERATYFFGSDNENYPGWDYSLNGHDVTPSGATLYAGYFAGGWFSMDEPLAALGDTFAAWVLVKAQSTQGAPAVETFLSSFSTAGGNRRAIEIGISGGQYKMLVTNTDGSAIIGSPGLPLTAGTGGQWDLLVGVVQPNRVSLYRRSLSMSDTVSADIAQAGNYGPEALTVGNNGDHSVTDDTKLIAAAGTLTGLLTSADVSTLYAGVQGQMAKVGLSV